MAAPNVNAGAFIPEIWDAAIQRTLEDNLILEKICSMKPSKDIAAYGDTIYFNGLADPTVADYTGTLTHETLVADQIPLLINKQKAFAFKVTDVEQAMANVDLKGSQAARAAYNLKDAVEKDVFTRLYLQAAAGTVTDTSVDSASVFGDISLATQYLLENNVSESDMWLAITPAIMVRLKNAGVKFQINNGINGKGGMMWTQDLGFDTFVTNTLYQSGGVHYCMAGSYQAIGFARKLLPTRSYELQTTRGTGIDGLMLYGDTVIKPKELVRLDLTPVADTGI